MTSLVAPTPDANQALEIARRAAVSVSDADLHFALLGYLYHNQPLIDPTRTDIDAIREVLHQSCTANLIRWPYIFGRSLYDRYNDRYSDGSDHLLAPDVGALLDGQPQGVYQVGYLLSGPLGFLDSREARLAPPTLAVDLWHCADTGCRTPHQVRFVPPQIGLVRAYAALTTAASQLWGPRSDWSYGFESLAVANTSFGNGDHYDIPTLIADCVIGEERTALVAASLRRDDTGGLKEALRTHAPSRFTQLGPPEKVAASLTPEEQLQALLLLPNPNILDLLDAAAIGGTLRIPPNEVRTPNRSFSSSGFARSRGTAISPHGTRLRRSSPIADLQSLLWESYSASGLENELSWRLLAGAGVPLRSALAEYIQTKDPSFAIRELIVSSQPITSAVAAKLRLRVAGMNHEQLTTALLWKMGFAIPTFDLSLPAFRRRVEQLKQAALNISRIVDETDREAIRAAGVNVFVSLEHLLEDMIGYNTWLLASDHFVNTRFVFDTREARAFVPVVLGTAINDANGYSCAWSTDGENTLGTLLRYLQEFQRWLDTRRDSDRAALLRPDDQVPFYASDSPERFAFHHVQFWADTDSRAFSEYIQIASYVIKRVGQIDIAALRNSIDHKRDEQAFPSVEDVLGFVSRVTEVIDVVDSARLVPKLFWAESQRKDRFGRDEATLVDRDGTRMILQRLVDLYDTPSIPFNRPVIVPPSGLLGKQIGYLVLLTRDASPFTDYWAAYPRVLERRMD